MLPSMLLACAVASAGQYATPQVTSPTLYYAPQPSAAVVAPTILVAAPPFWDRCLAKTGAWLSSRAALHQHPVTATLYVAPQNLATTCSAAAPSYTPVASAPAAVPLASSQAPVWRAEAEAAPPPPAPSVSPTSSPPPPAPSVSPTSSLTPEQRLSEIRRLLGP